MVPDVRGQENDIVHAIDDAIIAGADVINLSFGGPGSNGTSDMSRAADRAVANGVVVVAAAGNYGPNSQTINSPGDAFNVITVGATDDNNTQKIGDDVVADFSIRGPTGDGRIKPDVMAPGVDIIAPIDQGSAIWQTWPELRVGNFYAQLSGTSMAAPHVAGVAALILQAHPNWTPDMVKYAIKATANLNDILIRPDPTHNPKNDRGNGVVDAARAISYFIDIPTDQADNKYEHSWGDAGAIAYLNGTFRIWAVGTLLGGDAGAEARLNKTFTPTHWMSHPTFLFRFHDHGYMESDGGYATLYATLKLWQGNTILTSIEEAIHHVDWFNSYGVNCYHTLQLTYQGELLSGQQYKIEYGFRTYAFLAWSNFDSAPWRITALHLTANDTVGLGNPSFEERGVSVYDSWYWANNKAGWREFIGDLDANGAVNYDDQILFVTAYISYWTEPVGFKTVDDYKADFDGDGDIDYDDQITFVTSYIRYWSDSDRDNRRIDGAYSWYTSGGGDYTLSQWLCDHDVNITRGAFHIFTFTFSFNPETVAPDGTKNYARAEIYYITDTGSSQTIDGSWVYPTELNWYSVSLSISLPTNTLAIKITIHGGPDFKAWIDKASITIT